MDKITQNRIHLLIPEPFPQHFRPPCQVSPFFLFYVSKVIRLCAEMILFLPAAEII